MPLTDQQVAYGLLDVSYRDAVEGETLITVLMTMPRFMKHWMASTTSS
jgi:hypothetical protein